MKVKLSEIFVPLSGKNTYTVQELLNLELQPEFIKKLCARFDLSFVVNTSVESNLCFADNKDVRPEFRGTISRAEILQVIVPQIFTPDVNLARDEVFFPKGVHSFFSKTFTDLAAIKARKKYLRQTMLERRDNMPRKERNTYSQNICDQLWNLMLERDAQVIHSYLTMGSEVNVLPLLQKALDHGITVVAPKTLKKRRMQNLVLQDLKNMEAGIFGTYHPKDAVEYSGEYDLIIVAGLAFDDSGYRVGYGGGYYDTFLADHDTSFKAGVCYPFQFIQNVPVEAHDIQLNRVITSVG